MNRPDALEVAKRAAWKLWDDPDTRPNMPVYDGGLERILGAALDALAAVGLLLPEGAETRIEWGVERTYPGLDPVVTAYRSRFDAECAAGPVGHFEGRPLMERSTWTTPWRSVDAVRLAVGDSNPSVQDPSVSVEETPQ